MAKKDIGSKMLLEKPDNFADLMNVGLFHEKVISPEYLRVLNSDVSSLIDLGEAGILGFERRRDIIMAYDEERVFAILCVENQSSIDNSIPFRVLNYDDLGYLKQIRKIEYKITNIKKHIELLENLMSQGYDLEDEFVKSKEELKQAKKERCRPIITAVFYHGEGKWKKEIRLKELLCDIPPYLDEYVNDWKVPIINVNEMRIDELSALEMVNVIGLLYQVYNGEKGMSILGEVKNLTKEEAMILCSLATMPELKEEIEETKEEDFIMCQVYEKFIRDTTNAGIEIGRGEGIEIGRDEGIKIGRDQGIEIGRGEGIEIGRDQGIEIGRDEGIKIGETRGIALEKQNEVKMIQSLMKNANISLETAMDMLGLTSEKKQEFIAKLV